MSRERVEWRDLGRKGWIEGGRGEWREGGKERGMEREGGRDFVRVHLGEQFGMSHSHVSILDFLIKALQIQMNTFVAKLNKIHKNI